MMDQQSSSQVHFSRGAVTFLDVLGWKGIWARRDNALSSLADLVNEINVERNIRGTTTTVISISDTIAIFTEAEPERAISHHGKICAEAVCSSIRRRIPLRGATAYGDYAITGNIMVGPAVDEAASWYEMAECIGVILSPSASLSIHGKTVPGWKTDYRPFIKGGDKSIGGCLDWCSQWGPGQDNDERESSLVDIFLRMGPFVPGVASKYANTLDFFKHCTR